MGGQGQLGQMPTVRHDHHGHLGLIWRIAGLQKDCFKVKANCKERAAVSRASATAQGLPQASPRQVLHVWGRSLEQTPLRQPTQRHMDPRSPILWPSDAKF